MKMLKLLGATSVAALFAGAASAQLALEQSTTDATPTVSAPYAIANEVDFPALQLAGDADAIFGLEVLTQGVIPPGQNIFLTVNISNGTLTANLDGSEISSGITGAVVNANGAIGDSSVRYLITTDILDSSVNDPGTRDGIALNLPVEVTGCGDVNFSVTEFQTESGGTPIEGGSAALSVAGVATPAVTCEDAFQANLVVDAASTTLDFAAAFAEFVVAGPDTLTTGLLGDYDLTVDTTINIDMNSTPASPGDVLGFASSIDFADTTNIVSGTATTGDSLFADDGAPTAVVGSSIPLVGSTPAGAASETGIFTVTIAGPGFPVSPQTVSVSGAVLDLDTGDSLQATDAFLSADVEDLKLNGQYFGPFDWVSDSTKAVNTIFRVTGLDGLSDIPAQIIVQNSRNGLNGVYPFTILASDVQGSEIRLNSAALEAVAGLFGTADISIVFSTALDLDVDRLLAGPSTATVVPFGDGANDSGTGPAYGTDAPTPDNDDQGNF